MAAFEKLLKQQSIFFICFSSYILLYPQCRDSWEAKAQHESPRWCWFPHPPPDSPTGHWSAVVSGGQHAALSLVESLHFPASDWCGQWSAGQDWPPAAHHWSAVTSRLVRPARQKLSPTPTHYHHHHHRHQPIHNLSLSIFSFLSVALSSLFATSEIFMQCVWAFLLFSFHISCTIPYFAFTFTL